MKATGCTFSSQQCHYIMQWIQASGVELHTLLKANKKKENNSSWFNKFTTTTTTAKPQYDDHGKGSPNFSFRLGSFFILRERNFSKFIMKPKTWQKDAVMWDLNFFTQKNRHENSIKNVTS